MKYRFLIILVGIFMCHHLAFAQARKDLGTINDVAVTKEEVVREMRKYRANVFNAVTKKAALIGNDSPASKENNGEAMLKLLRNKVLDSLTAIKVQERLLLDRKIWPYKNYQEFKKDLINTNASRERSAGNENVIYGPVNYSEQVFFDYRFTNALSLLKRKLVEEKLLTVSENDLQYQFAKMQKTVYQGEKYTLHEYTRQVREAFLEEAYKKLINELARKATQDINIGEFNRITL
jgi:hypothetical protein